MNYIMLRKRKREFGLVRSSTIYLLSSSLLTVSMNSVGHMPFGKVDALRDQSNYANQIFQRYSNTIAAHFYGHS